MKATTSKVSKEKSLVISMKRMGHLNFIDAILLEGDLSYGIPFLNGNYQKSDLCLKLINDIVIMWL